jgi:integrase
MPYYLFWPDPDVMVAAGFGKVADVPVIFDSTWTQERVASRYLRERACLTLTQPILLDVVSKAGTIPTHQSLKTYAEALCNFLEWCELRTKDWQKLTYEEILIGYQAEMQRGTWSVRGKGLAPTTINGRVSQVCAYLNWASGLELRGPFYVPTTTKRIHAPTHKNSHGHRQKQVESQIGRVRENPMSLRLPTDDQVRKWRNSVAVRRGPTKGLLCDLIAQTGIRREEAVQWRVTTLPESKQEWNILGDQIQIRICYGAKGPKYPTEDGDRGPGRVITMPLALAERIHEYRTIRRPIQRGRYVKAATSQSERRERAREKVTRLFLSDDTGEPISANALYDAWKNEGDLPFAAWSPHLGRHYWSCKTLLQEHKKHLALLKSGQKIPGDWTTGLSTDTLSMIIQPQLGHLSERTSQGYLVWVKGALSLVGQQMAYDVELGEIFNCDPESEFPA